MSEFVLQLPGADPAIRRPFVAVAVVMRRERIDNRWQPWRWSLADIVPHEENFGDQPRLLLKDEQEERWLHPGFKVELFTDDAEGYYLNVTTPQPCFWVVWRMEEEAALADEPVAVPQTVTLSYHDAGRWLDAQETVEQVAAPRDVVEWVQAFVDAHYVLEAKRRQRPQSFKPLQDRFGNPARVSTDKKFGGGGGHG
ncbi:MAG: DUF3305 domain-containing protein [Polaromonas sp.]|uniref:DUF3305 domain-containing protein n=1 Tax=Polaromonas sp. TaxID=1869339 RepID=UPI002489FEC9|nr:DUF3305 domain-containing protein [Polaromonas sp.]MDI1237141.1 DUF3305 domain-containing protein [Polaromonas sp.]